MHKELNEDELYLLRVYKAQSVDELMELLENTRRFAADSVTSDAVSNLMLKVAYLTDEELHELQN